MFTEFLDFYVLITIIILFSIATVFLLYGLWSFTVKDFMKSVRYFCLTISAFLFFIIGVIFYRNHAEKKEFQKNFSGTYIFKDNSFISLSINGDFTTNNNKIRSEKGKWFVFHDEFGKEYLLELYDEEDILIEQFLITSANTSKEIKSVNQSLIGIENKVYKL